MLVEDHLVERKRLKEEGFKVTHQIKSITWIKLSLSLGSINKFISSECQEWFFGERSLLPSVGAYRLCVGKPSVVLERLTWKWWSEGHLRCLVEAIKRIDQEKASNTQKES